MIRLLAGILFVAIPLSAVVAQPGIRPFGAPPLPAVSPPVQPMPAAPAQPAPVQPTPVQPVAPAHPAAPVQPDDPVVVGRMVHLGWSLTGPRAKHYIFGGLAVADYVWQGKRRIVTLQEQTDLPQPDEN